jgi:hypothetical protein
MPGFAKGLEDKCNNPLDNYMLADLAEATPTKIL